jgi:hypothetical protein
MVNIIPANAECPICLQIFSEEADMIWYAHQPTQDCKIHAICRECFERLNKYNRKNLLVSCPECRVITFFTPGRTNDAIPVDPTTEELKEAFNRAIQTRNSEEVSDLLLNERLPEETIFKGFKKALDKEDEEIANLIYFSDRRDIDIEHLNFLLSFTWHTITPERLILHT